MGADAGARVAVAGRVLLADVSDRPLTAAVVRDLAEDIVTWRRDGYVPAAHRRAFGVQVEVSSLVDPPRPHNGSPTVWLDEDDGSVVIQGWKIADERTMSEITAAKPIPDHETVIRIPARMAAFLMEECGGGTTGIRPAPRG